MKTLGFWRSNFLITYTSRVGDESFPSLIDQLMFVKDWDCLFDNSGVLGLAHVFSDHFPLLIEAGAFVLGPIPFLFYND